jgi:signal transduction histidine kinase
MAGDLAVRLPVARRHDEIDMLASIVNAMMDDIERLVGEAKSVGDVIAHDLRTPLTRLRLTLDRLSHELHLSGAQGDLLDQAQQEADTLLGRFRAILRISEIENQTRRAGFTTVDLDSVIDQAVELYGPLAEDRGLALHKQVSTAARIQADPELMFEAVGNLIDNAVKFTPPGGRITLVLASGAHGPELQVVDNGPGIPAEERQAALQRFYRANQAQPTPGSGLGLSIVSAIAHLHGYGLRLEDAGPGLRVVLQCWARAMDY